MLLGTAGAALGYEEQTGTASLSMSYDLPEVVDEPAMETFTSRVETFLETFERWASRVEQEPVVQEPDVPAGMHGMLSV